MNRNRPLKLIVVLWLLCAFSYLVFIHSSGKSGIYIKRSQTVDPSEPPAPFVQLTVQSSRDGSWIHRELRLLRAAFFFSLLNAFNLGFKEVDFGRWLRMLLREEVELKAVGWARTLAGIQSLLTLYLMAIWVLITFGTPFS